PFGWASGRGSPANSSTSWSSSSKSSSGSGSDAMQFETELLRGAWSVQLKRFEDGRGSFVKTYARSAFDTALAASGGEPAFDWREEFYSLSNRDVVRGMHFQLPPHDHVKLVYCAAGAVLDVLLDLRAGP